MEFIISGFLTGALSLIPGISAGTVLVLIEKFERITKCIAKPWEHIKELSMIILGLLLGVLIAGRIIEFCFITIPHETLFFFGGLVLFSLPKLIKKEQGIALAKPMFFLLGMLCIGILYTLSVKHNMVITDFPKLTIPFLILFTLAGTLDGALTIFPGVSGSMTMMILGPYYLYKSYVANLSFAHLEFIIPLLAYFIGDMIGMFLGSRLSLFLIKKWHHQVMSFIYGMILMSAIVILPFSTMPNIFTATIAFLLSYAVVQFLAFHQT